MRNLVNECSTLNKDMSVDERNLLSVAYKNVIGARRASWRTLNAESQDEKNAGIIEKYKHQVEGELRLICKDVLFLLEKKLIDKQEVEKIKEEFKA